MSNLLIIGPFMSKRGNIIRLFLAPNIKLRHRFPTEVTNQSQLLLIILDTHLIRYSEMVELSLQELECYYVLPNIREFQRHRDIRTLPK